LGPSEETNIVGGPWLVADVGATNARFALATAAKAFEHIRVMACEDFDSIEDALEAYKMDVLPPARIPVRAAALAIAGPVIGDRVTLTNHPWSFSISRLRERLSLERIVVVNDLAAVARAVPRLESSECRQIGGGEVISQAPKGILAPGSGLGVSGIVPSGGDWVPICGEGGHVTMSAMTARESAVLDRMRSRFDHVSAERILSGPGLVNLYMTLAEIDGVRSASYTPPQITDPDICQRDAHCREAVDIFCAMLGTFAGNLALMLGALGGIYIAGGIVPKLGQRIADSAFRERFEAKGRLRSYLQRIPTYVVTHPFPALLGLATWLAAPKRGT
jgi:glucokinase